MIVEHNGTWLHIKDGFKPYLQIDELKKAIQPGDKFVMKCKIFSHKKRCLDECICTVEVIKAYPCGWYILKVIEEYEEIVRYKKKRKVISDIKTHKFEHEIQATIGALLADSSLGGILSSYELRDVLETKTLRELLEDKELGKRIIEDGLKGRRICLR